MKPKLSKLKITVQLICVLIILSVIALASNQITPPMSEIVILISASLFLIVSVLPKP